jgi:hypothetical protein
VALQTHIRPPLRNPGAEWYIPVQNRTQILKTSWNLSPGPGTPRKPVQAGFCFGLLAR